MNKYKVRFRGDQGSTRIEAERYSLKGEDYVFVCEDDAVVATVPRETVLSIEATSRPPRAD